MSAASKRFEVVLQAGVPVVYGASEAARRTGLAGEAMARARAVLETVRDLRSGTYGPADLAGIVLIERALELVKAGEKLVTGDTPKAETDTAADELSEVVFGRADWLVGERTPCGDIVPAGTLGRLS